MTTINCSSNCIHQKDGKCTLESFAVSQVSTASDCIFFSQKQLNNAINRKGK